MSYLGISDEIECEARRLCLAAEIDPEHRNPVGYWSYVIGGRSGPGHQAPKQWVDAEGPPAWTRFYVLAKGSLVPA